MVPLLQLFLLMPLIKPITNHVHGNSLSPLTTHSNHSLFSDVLVRKTDHRLGANAVLETVKPFLHGFYQKSVIKSSGDSNEWTESRNTEDTLSEKTSHTDITGSRSTFLLSPKNRVKRGSTQNVIPQNAAGKEKETADNTEFEEKDLSTVGPGDMLKPRETGFVRSSTEALTSLDKQHTQYRLQVQTVHSVLASLATVQINPTINSSLQTSPSTTSPLNENAVDTRSRMIQLDANRTRLEIGRFGTTTTAKIQPKRQFTTLQSHIETTSFSTSTTNLELEAPSPGVDIITSNNSQPESTSQSTKSAKISNDHSKERGTKGTVTDIKNTKGIPTFLRTASPLPTGHGHFVFSENDGRFTEKDQSVSQGIAPSLKSNPASPTYALPKDLCATGVGPCVFSKDQNNDEKYGATNGSFLVWADLKRTLSFAWELHVFGSAALFLLLTAGSALGLALSPSLYCPHRGELVLTNSLLLVVGAVRAGHFLLDPYGTRLLLPLPVVIALYTLPLPLLILAQAALVILVLKETGVTWIPPTLQRPPLLGVLAVFQCTLLLAADLLSPALSPAVPIVLQSLTLTAGLVLCLGYLFLALPCFSHTHAARRGNKGKGEGKVWVLARVLAVCAFLGALCCLLHIYACLWLYGLLGDWRRFRWAWWLCQFWVRLLELAWAFCLLLMSSWVFWRPNQGHICGAPRQEGAATESLPSPSQSSNSTSRHTCWAKIVQSLKVRQQRKSESNGIGGSKIGAAAGELPNNWTGEELSGADISKSLIGNRDPLKDSNNLCNLKSFAGGSAGSLLRLQALAQPSQRLSSSLDRDKESAISLCDFDLRPPTPIDLSRSIDEALHHVNLLRGESLFQPLRPPSLPPSPHLWMRQNSEPQITLSLSSDEHTLFTESSASLDRSIPSAVPSRQVTAPPTPTHQGFRWVSEAQVPSSLSCPVSLHHSPSTSHALVPNAENTRPFLTPDLESSQSNTRGGQSYLKVTRNDDSASVSSDIIDL
ncbi:proline-rich transmembrane protein 3-like [Sinocyclocheilus anshuiensis]|uniref:proline-rich transmembrane protein 3-like n=1 Tax=Sinocyclocheilus anshuiensis TaxID=1608454 RepID=UPI0007B85BBF|nr:PREDICTED: proline-rich transmembrane protein 3-like [Sinocyclocheilus anshuiensis]XP_016348306.1 PREDICTED: proline-rich transmembrane protein 3-like [Sinocyclocheilus anshuiensis]XP_016348307.1 PREDICTED: proline-rich transmembrane protein 3-like [Sinocyclocheilus anshuiensis]XP_016348308.1 PREDICTED: proline-rich transmembrane protein 3-like [Sinocyclocheilus anshuiensis]